MIRYEKQIPHVWKIWYIPLLERLGVGYEERPCNADQVTLVLLFEKAAEFHEKLDLLKRLEIKLSSLPQSTDYYSRFFIKIRDAGIFWQPDFGLIKEMRDAGMSAEAAAEKYITDYRRSNNNLN